MPLYEDHTTKYLNSITKEYKNDISSSQLEIRQEHTIADLKILCRQLNAKANLLSWKNERLMKENEL